MLIALLAVAVAATGCESDDGPGEVAPERSIAGRISGYDPNWWIRELPTRIHFLDDRRGLMAIHDGRRFATRDGGTTWRRAGRVTLRGDLLGRPLPRASIVDIEFVDRLRGWAASRHRVFRTVDGGRTWRGLPLDCPGDEHLPALAGIAFVDRVRGFALCGGQPGAGQQLKELYATVDGGETWKRHTGWRRMPSFGYASGLDFRTVDEGLMTTARGGIHRTLDGGTTWPIALVTHDWTPLAIAWPSTRRIYAALWRVGLVRSDDGGRRWRQVYPPPPGPPAGPLSFSSGDRGIGVGTGGLFRNPGVVLQTSDGGRSWSELSRLPRFDVRQIERVSSTSIWVVAARRLRHGLSGGIRILRSTDGGRTWRMLRSPPAAFGTLGLVSDRIAVLAANTGLFRTEDGGSTWERAGRRELYGIRFLSKDRGFSSGGDYILLRTNDGGKSWERLPVRGGFRVLSISTFPPNHVWLTGNVCRRYSCRGRTLRSSDGGDTWEEIRFRVAVPPEATQWLDARRGFAPFGEGGHYRTSDGGRTWRFVEPTYGIRPRS